MNDNKNEKGLNIVLTKNRGQLIFEKLKDSPYKFWVLQFKVRTIILKDLWDSSYYIDSSGTDIRYGDIKELLN